MTEADDLEAFIQTQKEKIARERNQLVNKGGPVDDTNTPKRKQWEKDPPEEPMFKNEEGEMNGDENGFKFESYKKEQEKKKLHEERKNEYNALNKQFQPKQTTRQPQPAEETGLPLLPSTYDEKRKELNENRKKEYNELISQNPKMRANRMKENIPPKPDTPEVGLVGKMVSTEEKRRMLQEERRQEYNKMLADQNLRRTGRGEAKSDFTGGTLPGLQDRLSAQKDRGRSQTQADEPQDKTRRREAEDAYGTLPIKEHPSAEVRKIQQRNQEYNEFLKQKKLREERSRSQMNHNADSDDDDFKQYLQERQPRKGWSTPTYDEILEKKRQEERKYRKQDDPELYNAGYLRASRSDGQLNRMAEDERRFRNIDREINTMKTQFPRETRRTHILEDPNWLDIASPRNIRPYKDLDLDDDVDLLARLHLRSHSDHGDDMVKHLKNKDVPSRAATRADNPASYRPADARPPPGRPGEFAGTLLVGNQTRVSADQRRKDAYRRDLEEQMNQFKANKQREKQSELRVNATGEIDVGRKPERQALPEDTTPHKPTRNYKDTEFSPRNILFDDKRDYGRQNKDKNILDNGFQGLYYPSLLSGQNPYSSPQDEAYYYYGMRNPLDPSMATVGAPALPETRQPGPRDYAEAPRVRFENQPPGPTGPTPSIGARHIEEPRKAGQFPSDEDRNQSQTDSKRAYQEELKRQIEEQKQKKQKEKEDKERYDRKVEQEAVVFDPFGRGGGGAPMRTQDGEIIANRKQQPRAADQTKPSNADLRSMHLDNEDVWKSPRKPPPPPRGNTIPDTSYGSPPNPPPGGNTDEGGHARGGHGIFGEPMTDAQKNARTRYQDELRNQIEEKKKIEQQEKDRQKAEEEKLLRKIEEDNKRMQDELDAEKRKEREKQEAAQKQQEDLRRQQEERKKEEERKRREADDERQQELRKQEEEKRRQRQQEQNDQRSNSPPIPSLRKNQPPASPPVPAQRTQSRQSNANPRVNSSDVLGQLARMRQQLQSERMRVESSLKREKNEPDVYDPRVYSKPVPGPSARNNIDIFEVAHNNKPVSVRRAPTDQSNPSQVQEFSRLKGKRGSESRSDFRKIFPNTPLTNDALETQQRALLLRQESDLDKLRRSPESTDLAAMSPHDLGLLRREPSVISANMLDSESAFIDVPDSDIPYNPRRRETEDILRNNSARNRRRQPPSPAGGISMGSQVSLDPEKIDRKNEERLRKLKNITGDELSMGDPDDILDRFMAKQQHNRPPSGQTLQDDSWLRPGTRVDRS